MNGFENFRKFYIDPLRVSSKLQTKAPFRKLHGTCFIVCKDIHEAKNIQSSRTEKNPTGIIPGILILQYFKIS